MHRKVAAALVAALAVGIASCGGSESEPLSRAQLVERIELACREAQRRAQARVNAERGAGRGFFTILAAVQRQIDERLDELEPPDGASSAFETFKQGMSERTELTERLEGLRDEQLSRAIADAEDEGRAMIERAQAAAQRLGVKGCF